jgi:hypothetical protein
MSRPAFCGEHAGSGATGVIEMPYCGAVIGYVETTFAPWSAPSERAILLPVRNRFDHLAKQIGQEALGPSGTTVVHDEISPETQHADLRHDPDPAREAERARLGLLGRIAAVLCLIEIYGHAPDAEEVRACLSKHLAFWQDRARKARKTQKTATFVEPFLWILSAGCPTSVLAGLKLGAAPGWPPGVYFGPELLRTGLVVASELPRDRSTLLVRLMAAGPLLAHAIEDLAALPPAAHERAVAQQILLNLKHALGKKASRTPEEQEFIVIMQDTWEQAREIGRDEGRTEGLNEGRAEGERAMLLRQLRARFGELPAAAVARVEGAEILVLERWGERVLSAKSLVEVLDDPS